MGFYDGINNAKRMQQQYDAARPGPGASFEQGWRDENTRGQGYDQNYDQSRSAWQQALQGGQSAFEQSAKSAVSAALPGFYSALNGVRENALSRGVQNGELGTSYEGDLASAFQKNIANSIGSQALGLWNSQQQGYGNMAGLDANVASGSHNRYMSAVNDALDRKEQARNRKASTTNSIIGGIGSLGGAALGFFG